jgi:hypothetical protein
VLCEVGNHPLRLRHVVAQVTAAIHVRHGDGFRNHLADTPHHTIGALDRGKHQDVVAHTHAPILTPVAEEMRDSH